MSKSRFFWISIILILLAFLGGLIWAYFHPLSQPLSISVTPTLVTTLPPSNPEVPLPEATPMAEVCGHKGVSTTLFMARDQSIGDFPPGADIIRYININYSQKKIIILAVPRDLWLKAQVLADPNNEYSRLGRVFFAAEQASSGTTKEKYQAGINAVAQTLYDNFGIVPNNYIYFEMTSFAEGIDQLGGLDVTIPQAFTYSNYTFNAGPQHLSGDQVLTYARFLPGDELTNGWDRIDRQNIIANALRAKMTDPANLVKVPGLVTLFWNDLLTDLSPNTIADMVCMINEVTLDNIALIEVDASMITGPGPDSSMIPNVDQVKAFMQEQLKH